jgi:hypothetical protein
LNYCQPLSVAKHLVVADGLEIIATTTSVNKVDAQWNAHAKTPKADDTSMACVTGPTEGRIILSEGTRICRNETRIIRMWRRGLRIAMEKYRHSSGRCWRCEQGRILSFILVEVSAGAAAAHGVRLDA